MESDAAVESHRYLSVVEQLDRDAYDRDTCISGAYYTSMAIGTRVNIPRRRLSLQPGVWPGSRQHTYTGLVVDYRDTVIL
jgi:hypothetical protein